MLAISAARATPWRSSSAAQRARQRRRVGGRHLPAERRADFLQRCARLGAASDWKKRAGKEMDVRVRRRRYHPTGFASGLFQCVRPAASASCVRPATLLTPSFFIIVLR